MGTADALRYIKDKIEVSIKFMVRIYCTNTVNNIYQCIYNCATLLLYTGIKRAGLSWHAV